MSELTTDQKKKFQENMLSLLESELSKEDNSHLKLKFILESNPNLNPVQNLKIRIVNDVLDFYKKYPHLHCIRFNHWTSAQNYSVKGWNASVSQVAWDTVENIKITDEYKKSNCNMYAYCNNTMINRKDEKIIEVNGGEKISVIELREIVRNHFNYMNDAGAGEELKQEFKSKKTDPKDTYYAFELASRNWYGWQNIKMQKDIEEFLGNDMKVTMRFLHLSEHIACDEKPTVKKMKL